MAIRSMLGNSLVEAPAAIAAGVGREILAQRANPSFKGLPVDKRAWWLDVALLGLGVVGKVVAGITRDDVWDETTEGLYHAGLAYVSQDLAHEVSRRGAGNVQPQAPATVMLQDVPRAAYVPAVAPSAGAMLAEEF